MHTPETEIEKVEKEIDIIAKEVQQKNKMTLSTPGAIILGSLIIAGAILTGPIFNKSFSTLTTDTNSGILPQKQITMQSVTNMDHIFGDANKAKVFIVEYSDLECPYCKDFHQTVHKLVDHYAGKVA